MRAEGEAMKIRIATFTFACLVAATLGAQAADSSAPAGENAPGTEAPAPTAEAKAQIEEILEGEEQVLQGLVTSYDPGDRRDPFRSLFTPPPAKDRAKRPEGVPGLLIDEIRIKGVFRTSKGFVAQISAQNQRKSFLLREGEQVFDGDVLRIEKNKVIFRQIVNDPTVIKPFREVVKAIS
jgi:hypothetical protein